MESLEQSVDQFLEYFRERIAEIKAASFGPATKLFKKILYVGILDALSKAVSYPTMGTLLTSWTNPARIIDPLKLSELSPRSQQRPLSLLLSLRTQNIPRKSSRMQRAIYSQTVTAIGEDRPLAAAHG